jgi:hypothetical protein
VQVLAGLSVGAAIDITGAGAVIGADYFPYDSSFSTYGAGCAGSNSKTPAIGSRGVPYPANFTFAITLANTIADANTVLLFGAMMTQTSLTPIGAPGCTLLTQPLLGFPVKADAMGNAILFIPIPADPNLVGGTPLFQWAVLDSAANAIGIVMSDGGRGGV